MGRRYGTGAGEAWQLAMFRHSLKKQQKVQALLGLVGDLSGQQCLLVTCGDNNGSLNWHFRRHGGQWTWVDAEDESARLIGELTGDPVIVMDKADMALPLPQDQYDLVLTIDVHEHLDAPAQLNRELARLVKPGGRVVVTTPIGDEGKLAQRIKEWVGMRPQVYGHTVMGYGTDELADQLRSVGLQPVASATYARFFTEFLELLINFAYVKILSKGSKASVHSGQIAPQNQDQLKSVGSSYRLYAAAFPFLKLISQLDRLIAFRSGYAAIVMARKAAA